MKLHKGDTVIVNIGKDSGRKGKVEKVFPADGTVLVTGINMVKRHMKKRDEKHLGGIIDLTKPIAVSKVALVCPKCNHMTRIGYIVAKGLRGEKERMCRKCEQRI